MLYVFEGSLCQSCKYIYGLTTSIRWYVCELEANFESSGSRNRDPQEGAVRPAAGSL